jgi:hypothetical protein
MFGWRGVHVPYFRLWRERCRDQGLLLTNCMERSPSWKAAPCMWWNPNVHYHAYEIPTFLLILSQMNPVHVLPVCFFKIDFRIILPCNVCLSLPSHFSNSGVSHQNSVRIYCLPHTCHMPLASLIHDLITPVLRSTNHYASNFVFFSITHRSKYPIVDES